MNNTFKVSVLGLLLVASAEAATLSFSNAGTPALATNFQDSLGSNVSGLIWGVVIDTTGNGFATSNWNSGFTYTTGNTTGITLQAITGGATDDVLFINATTMTSANGADSSVVGAGRVNTISSVDFSSNPSWAGKAFAIIWFDRTTIANSVSTTGQKFGLVTTGTVGSPAFLLPASNGDVVDYSNAFVGTDPAKPMSFQFGAIPEPSTALLGAVGALGLLRRRRN